LLKQQQYAFEQKLWHQSGIETTGEQIKFTC